MNDEELPLSFLVVDDHEFVLDGVKTLLNSNFSKSQITTTGSVEEALELLQTTNEHPDILITDLNLPGKSGVHLTQAVKQAYAGIKVVAFTGYTDNEHIRGVYIAGADAILSKSDQKEEMFQALHHISQNRRYFSPEIQKIIDGLIAQPRQEDKDEKPHFTRMQKQVIKLLAQGLTNKQISKKLHRSTHTIADHRQMIYKKADVNNIAQLLEKLRKWDML